MWRAVGSGGAAFANTATAAQISMLDALQSCITLSLRCVAAIFHPDGRIEGMHNPWPARSHWTVIPIVGGEEEVIYPALHRPSCHTFDLLFLEGFGLSCPGLLGRQLRRGPCLRLRTSGSLSGRGVWYDEAEIPRRRFFFIRTLKRHLNGIGL